MTDREKAYLSELADYGAAEAVLKAVAPWD